MARILVTGCAGMIGSSLVRRLVQNGHEVKGVDNLWRGKLENLRDNDRWIIDMDRDFHNRDLSVPNQLDDLLDGIDYVYHLADVVAGIGYVFANQLGIFRQNLLINTHVVESICKARSLKGYIYVGTACSFPQELQTGPDAPPLKEDDLYPASPESAYGWSKLMGQYEAQLMEQDFAIPVCLPVLHNVYGSPCDFSPERSQVIPSLIRRAIEYPKAGPFVVWGTGEQGRAFVHVSDVVDGLILAMERGLGQGVIQIGPDQCTTIRHAAETIVNISQKNIEIHFDETKPMGDLGRCADYGKAREVLGWEPKISFADGMTWLYDWIEHQMTQGTN
ncbi:MAG: NAD-dependent epimerase/dehydratase family protein [Novosphingobium sp.]|nr:NAD-dependent epimerase/dehydratase family protein [Novosphingobium sp.]